MKRFFNVCVGGHLRSLALSLVFSTLFIAVSVGAATTISTNITTGGTLSVTGASTLTGNVTAAGTLGVTGLTTMVYASSTGQSLTGNIQVAGNILANGYATTTGSNGNFATEGTLTSVGLASTTSLVVGGNSTNGTLAGMIHGTCNLGQASITASSTRGLVCSSATGVTTAFKVFVTATSSLATHLGSPSNGFAIVAASSTAVGTIGVEVSNLTGAANTPAGTLNFWAVR